MGPARLQLVVGLLNAWAYGAIAWAVCGNVCGGLTASFGSIGGLCGWTGLLLVPLGWIEIFVAVSSRRGDYRRNRQLAWLQLASLAIGGLPSAVVGLYVLRTTSRPRRSASD